jgi:cell division protein FtsN
MQTMSHHQPLHSQRGGTVLGLIIGLVLGLAISLGVAVYVTKVPLPFMNKAQTRNADQDAAEVQKNKDWDPNALLPGRMAGKAAPAAPVPSSETGTVPEAPATVLVPKPDPKADATVGAPPGADKARSGDPVTQYFVQVGAFRTLEDAESHRAKLLLSGIETKISEREQSGRTVYRVRVGPFDKLEEGERTKDKLDKAGIETALVRVQN